jgi:hypothetical protein
MVKKEEINTKLTGENAELRSQVAALTTQLQQAKWRSFTSDDNANRDLVLSDSTLSAVDTDKLQNTRLVCVPDAKAETLTEELQKPEHKDKSYDRIVLVVGSNDISECKDNEESANVVPKFASLIDKAKTKATQVSISSVCPRLDRPEIKERIDAFNANLQVLCTDNECDFTDNTPSFTLGTGDINDGYLAMGKGPHLSKAGVNNLVRNLKLRTKQDITDFTRSHHQRNAVQKNAVHQQKNSVPQKRSSQQERSSQYQRSSRNQSPRKCSSGEQVTSHDDVVFNRNACYFCNIPGHRADDCRHKGPVTCHACGEQGHKRKHHSSYSSQRYDY